MKYNKEFSLTNEDKISHQCVIRIKSVYPSLKNLEKRLLEYIVSEPEEFSNSLVAEVSNKVNCSQATVVRLARKLGYSGFSELKNSILKDNLESTPLYQNILKEDNINDVVKKVFMTSLQSIQDTLTVIDMNNINASVNKLLHANKIMFIGSGDAAVVALAGYLKFSRIGILSFFSFDYDSQLILSSQLKEKDVLIVVSHSGNTKTILDIIKNAKNYGAEIITITNFPLSVIGKNSDIILSTSTYANKNDEVIIKRIPELCIIESLYISLLHMKEDKYQSVIENSNNSVEYNKLH